MLRQLSLRYSRKGRVLQQQGQFQHIGMVTWRTTFDVCNHRMGGSGTTVGTQKGFAERGLGTMMMRRTLTWGRGMGVVTTWYLWKILSFIRIMGPRGP